MRTKTLVAAVVVIYSLAVLLSSCGGGGGGTATPTPTYTVGGTVSGLVGTGLVVQNNGGDNLTINADGSFTFPAAQNEGSNYAITVVAQPSGPTQRCIVVKASGAITSSNVNSVRVSCRGYDLVAGSAHNCTLLNNGSVKCWGFNLAGELGIGDTNSRGDAANEMGPNLPYVDLGTGAKASQLAAAGGEGHTCVLLDNGSVKCWGYNRSGELGVGDTNNRGDQAGEMGDSLPAVDLGSGRIALQLAAGSGHTCALLDNGSVKCWGNNFVGQLGLGDTSYRGDQAGEMGDSLPAVDLGSGRTALQLAAGSEHTCALLDNGSVKCWGWNIFGQLGLGDTNNRGDQAGEMGDTLPIVDVGIGRFAMAISANVNNTCALLDDGTVKCWGDNSTGQLGLGDTLDRGDEINEMGNNLPIVNLGAGLTVTQIVSGGYHACAMLDNATIKCWGYNPFGQLGLGDSEYRGDQTGEMGDNLPTVNLGMGRTALKLAGGGYHTCAQLDDATLKCWGLNNYGQLGLGDTVTRGDQVNEMGDNLPPVSLVPKLVISEIMKNPNVLADAVGEWIEIYNAGFSSFDLSGCTLSDAGMNLHTINTSVIVPAGGYVTLAASYTSGFAPTEYVYTQSEFQLGNNDDEVILTCNGIVLDLVAYDILNFPNVAGASLSLNPLKLNAVDNDTGANWCAATTSYNGDLGTPRAMNDACP